MHPSVAATILDLTTTASCTKASVIGSAKVVGTIVTVASETPTDAGERIAVACPYCHLVHFHFASRTPISTFVVPGIPGPDGEPADEMVDHEESGDDSGDNDKDSAAKGTSPNWVWETDRVADCRRGTYHIVGR
jgi:hypothetical protein